MASPLLLHIMLHRTLNWTCKMMPDAAGNECLHFCIPCDINGIELRAKRKSTILEPDGSNVAVASWRFKASPTFRMGAKLYCLLLQISKDLYHQLVDQGQINCNEKKNVHGIMGDIEKWPYANGKSE